MNRFETKCPLCQNIGSVETVDGRNMFSCYSCGLNTPLINIKNYGKSTDEKKSGNDSERNV